MSCILEVEKLILAATVSEDSTNYQVFSYKMPKNLNLLLLTQNEDRTEEESQFCNFYWLLNVYCSGMRDERNQM